jgi:hypothetical protein
VNPTIQACTEADATALSRLLVRTWHATFDRIYGVEKVDEITSKWHAPDQLRMQMSQAGSITLASVMNGEFVGTVTGFNASTSRRNISVRALVRGCSMHSSNLLLLHYASN